MDDRRKQPRDKVTLGAVASKDQTANDCIVRDMSDDGARIQFPPDHRPIKEQMTLSIDRDGRTVTADIVWTNGNVVGVSFNNARAGEASDLDARVRKSEAKKRELQIEIQRLLGK